MQTIREGILKFFKKLTILDWIFIIGAFVLFLGFYLYFRREVRFVTIRFKVTDEDTLYAIHTPKNEYTFSFLKGDVEKDEIGRTVSEITNVDSYRVTTEEKLVYVDVRLKAVYNPRKNVYSLKGKNLIFGESFVFNFSKVRFRGLVVDFPGLEESVGVKEGKTIVISQVRYANREFSDVYGVPDYIANALKVGDKVVQSSGLTLAEIKNIKIVPAERTVINESGQAYVIDDPLLKDVYLTVELSTKEINNELYMFDYIPVKLGQVIPLQFPKVGVYPVITDIQK